MEDLGLCGRPTACACWQTVPRALAATTFAVLTQLVKVGVAAVGPRNRADQASLQECCPFVDQTSLAAHVILIENKRGEV